MNRYETGEQVKGVEWEKGGRECKPIAEWSSECRNIEKREKLI